MTNEGMHLVPDGESEEARSIDPDLQNVETDETDETDETANADGRQPESQGEDPLVADLGDTGQGDLAPEDL